MADGTQFTPTSLLMFVAVEIGLPTGMPLRLMDGSGQVTFAGRTFTGSDPVYGVLAALEPVQDGLGDEAPSLRIGINPPTPSASAMLAAANMQGQSVLVWIGTVTPATGSVVPDPLLIFAGNIDQGVVSIGLGTRSVALDCVSIWERLFEDLEGPRLNNAYHQSVYPGELGFEFVTSVQRQLPWGADTPRPAVVADALYTRP
jgi:hypothetical protein